MIIRKRLLNRLHYGKRFWRYRHFYRYEIHFALWKRIQKIHKEPEFPEILFGYWFAGSRTTGDAMDDWGFRVYQDGRIVYMNGYYLYGERRREWEFRLPKACLSELQGMLASHNGEYQTHRIGTSCCGMLRGWQDIFYLSGFYFSAWCIRHHLLEKLRRQHPSKAYWNACL